MLMPTMPASSASATRQTRPMSRPIEVRGQAELGVVRQRDRLLLGLEPEERRDRAERLLARDHHRGRDIGQHRRLEEPAAQRDADGRRRQSSRLCCTRVLNVLFDLRDRLVVDERPLGRARLEAVGRVQRGHARRQLRGKRVVDRSPARRCGSRTRTSGRCCGTSRPSTPSTAASRSASSNTMNGALPPSSSESFLTVRRALRHEQLADLGGAGERQLAHDRIRGQLAADLARPSR